MTIPEGNYTEEELGKFRNIFDTYYENIRNYIYFKTGDINLAEDIVQEVFLKIWDIRNTLRDDTIKSLLYTIAGNLMRNHFNHAKVVYNFQKENHGERESEPADFSLEQDEFHQKLQQVLSAMPETSRIVFLMNRMDDLTYEEIAERLNLSIKAIEKRMHIALKILKKQIEHKI